MFVDFVYGTDWSKNVVLLINNRYWEHLTHTWNIVFLRVNKSARKQGGRVNQETNCNITASCEFSIFSIASSFLYSSIVRLMLRVTNKHSLRGSDDAVLRTTQLLC